MKPALKKVKFDVTYLSGYKYDEKGFKNKLTEWKAIKSDKNEIQVQLTFSNPIYVAMKRKNCRIKICFGDGLLFKSAGFSTSIEKGTCKEEVLYPQLGTDAGSKAMIPVTKGLKTVLEILSGAGFFLNFLYGFTLSYIYEMLTGL
jgi:hypothetical protein